MANNGAEGERVDIQAPVTRQPEDAQHQYGFDRKIKARCRNDLAIRQRKSRFCQSLVGRGQHGRAAKCSANNGGFQNAGEARHITHGQEEMLHEAFNAILKPAPRIAHAGANHRLQVKRQAFFRAARDDVQVKAHGPQEIPGAANGARLTCCQQPAAWAIGADQFRHAFHIEGIARQPIKRL